MPSDRHIFWSCRIEFYHSSLRSVYYLSYVVNTTVIRYCNNSEGLLTNFSTLRHTSQIRHAIFFSNVKVLVTLLNKLALTPQLFFFFAAAALSRFLKPLLKIIHNLVAIIRWPTRLVLTISLTQKKKEKKNLGHTQVLQKGIWESSWSTLISVVSHVFYYYFWLKCRGQLGCKRQPMNGAITIMLYTVPLSNYKKQQGAVLGVPLREHLHAATP